MRGGCPRVSVGDFVVVWEEDCPRSSGDGICVWGAGGGVLPWPRKGPWALHILGSSNLADQKPWALLTPGNFCAYNLGSWGFSRFKIFSFYNYFSLLQLPDPKKFKLSKIELIYKAQKLKLPPLQSRI